MQTYGGPLEEVLGCIPEDVISRGQVTLSVRAKTSGLMADGSNHGGEDVQPVFVCWI